MGKYKAIDKFIDMLFDRLTQHMINDMKDKEVLLLFNETNYGIIKNNLDIFNNMDYDKKLEYFTLLFEYIKKNNGNVKINMDFYKFLVENNKK